MAIAYCNVKYKDVTEYNHGIHAIDGGHFEIVNVVNYKGKGSDVRVYLKCDECGEEINIPYFLVKLIVSRAVRNRSFFFSAF